VKGENDMLIDNFVPAFEVGANNYEKLYVNRRGQFFLQVYIEDGDFLKVKEVDRESAINWCMDNKLPEWDFRPLFGLWD